MNRIKQLIITTFASVLAACGGVGGNPGLVTQPTNRELRLA